MRRYYPLTIVSYCFKIAFIFSVLLTPVRIGATEATIRTMTDKEAETWVKSYNTEPPPHILVIKNLEQRMTKVELVFPRRFVFKAKEAPTVPLDFILFSVFDPDPDTKKGEPDKFGEVRMAGVFDLDISYELTVNYTDTVLGSKPYEVTVDKEVLKTRPAFSFTRFAKASRLSIDIYTPDDVEALGFSYNASLTMKKARPYWLNLKSYGNISTDLNAKSLQTNMTSGAEFKRFEYPFGARGAFDFETNQDWSIIDMAAKGEAVIAIPYGFKQALIFWHKLTNTNRIFFPPTAYFGYAYVRDIKDDVNDPPAKEDDHRLDFGANWNMPFTTKTDLAIKYSAVYFVKSENNDGNNYKYYIDIRGKYYLDGNMSRGFEVGYQKGALPPEYKETETVLAGFTIKMF